MPGTGMETGAVNRNSRPGIGVEKSAGRGVASCDRALLAVRPIMEVILSHALYTAVPQTSRSHPIPHVTTPSITPPTSQRLLALCDSCQRSGAALSKSAELLWRPNWQSPDLPCRLDLLPARLAEPGASVIRSSAPLP